VRWTALETDVVDLEAFIAINRARNWDEFRQALTLYGGPPQNFAYADTAGHIGHHTAGRIPLRKTGDGSVPYDGTTDDGDWVRFIPFEELPHVLDPVSGIIIAANNCIVGDDYPHHITHNWRVPYRARRIHNLLKARDHPQCRGLTTTGGTNKNQKFPITDFQIQVVDRFDFFLALLVSEYFVDITKGYAGHNVERLTRWIRQTVSGVSGLSA